MDNYQSTILSMADYGNVSRKTIEKTVSPVRSVTSKANPTSHVEPRSIPSKPVQVQKFDIRQKLDAMQNLKNMRNRPTFDELDHHEPRHIVQYSRQPAYDTGTTSSSTRKYRDTSVSLLKGKLIDKSRDELSGTSSSVYQSRSFSSVSKDRQAKFLKKQTIDVSISKYTVLNTDKVTVRGKLSECRANFNMKEVRVLPHPVSSCDNWRVVEHKSFLVVQDNGATATVSVNLENVSTGSVVIREGTLIARVELENS